VVSSAAEHFAGLASLAATLSTVPAQKFQVAVSTPTGGPPASAKVTFHVLVPTGAPLGSIQPYVKTGAPGYTWTGVTVSAPTLKLGAWNTVVVTVPGASPAIQELGVQLDVTQSWTGTVYVDTVTW
jgi:hypothetical protein